MFSMDLRPDESCASAVVAERDLVDAIVAEAAASAITATASPAALVRHAPRPSAAGGVSG
jgi:hypothetical protein